MKTKEEVIQEAWGRYWDEVKHNVKGMDTKGGWADNDVIHYNEDLGCDSNGFEFEGTLYRPKSLAGIETNNGWIRIESVDDIPTELMECYVFDDDGDICYYTFGIDNSKDYAEVVNGAITHYQPIIKPLPPLY